MESDHSETSAGSTTQEVLANAESTAVVRFRLLLAAVAMAASSVVYTTTLKAEDREFKSSFVRDLRPLARSGYP